MRKQPDRDREFYDTSAQSFGAIALATAAFSSEPHIASGIALTTSVGQLLSVKLRSKLKSASNIDHQIRKLSKELEALWVKWGESFANDSGKRIDISNASKHFQEYVTNHSQLIQLTTEQLLDLSKDPIKIADAVLQHATQVSPSTYSNIPKNHISRDFFRKVVTAVFEHLLSNQEFLNSLSPDFQQLVFSMSKETRDNTDILIQKSNAQEKKIDLLMEMVANSSIAGATNDGQSVANEVEPKFNAHVVQSKQLGASLKAGLADDNSKISESITNALDVDDRNISIQSLKAIFQKEVDTALCANIKASEAQKNIGLLTFPSSAEDAIQAYKEAVYLNDKDPQAWMLLGQSLYSIGNASAAENCYLDALRVETGDHQFYAAINTDLGILYSDISKFDKSEEHFKKALEINRKLTRHDAEAGSLLSLAQTYRLQGQHKPAIEYLELSKKVCTQHEVYSTLCTVQIEFGTIYNYRGQLQQAVDSYLGAQKTNDDHLKCAAGLAVINGNLGMVYKAAKQFKEAIQTTKFALKCNRDLERKKGIQIQLYNLGIVLVDSSKDSDTLIEAEQCFREGVSLSQGPHESFSKEQCNFGLGMIDFYRKHYKEAEKKFLGAITVFRKGNYRVELAGSLYQLARVYSYWNPMNKSPIVILEEALTTFQDLKMPEQSAETTQLIGLIYLQIGQLQIGRHYLEKSKSIFENIPAKDRAELLSELLSLLPTR